MQELKDIVFKNLQKDPIHYTKDGQFGEKGLGYTTEAPGLGEPKEAKGKYKASGYGDLKEGYDKFASDVKDAVTKKKDSKFTDKEKADKILQRKKEDHKRRKEAGEPYDETLLREAIRKMIDEELNTEEFKDALIKMEQPYLNDKEALGDIQKIYTSHSAGLNSIAQNLKESVEKDLAAINKEAEHEVLQSKMEKIQALIDKKQSQISRLDEDEDMKDLTDDKKVKEISKDIKALEKAKAKLEKIMSKFKGKKKEVIDETEDELADEYIEDADERQDDGEKTDSILSNYNNLSFNDRVDLRGELDDRAEEKGYSND
jgi:predicted component of type VI protein secretion system